MTQGLVSTNYKDCLTFPIHSDLSHPSQLMPPSCPGTGLPHHTLTVRDSQADVTLKSRLKEPMPKGEEGILKGEITEIDGIQVTMKNPGTGLIYHTGF